MFTADMLTKLFPREKIVENEKHETNNTRRFSAVATNAIGLHFHKPHKSSRYCLYNRRRPRKNLLFLPRFSASLSLCVFLPRIFEDFQKNWLVFLEDHSRDVKVPFKQFDFLSKVSRSIRHVQPFLHFIEELNEAVKTQKSNTSQVCLSVEKLK